LPRQPLEKADLLPASLSEELFKTSERLKALFKLILNGDSEAAQLLLLNLVSKVYQRTPEGIVLGHLNINLSGLKPLHAKLIRQLLSVCLLTQLNLQITTESLSEMRFQPRKNYDTN
jgi:hypothetical protein